MTETAVAAERQQNSNRCTAASHDGYRNMAGNFRPGWSVLDSGTQAACGDCTRFGKDGCSCGSTEEAEYAKPRTLPGPITTSDDYLEADLVRMPECEDIEDPSDWERASRSI